jgi:hypothetical protein
MSILTIDQCLLYTLSLEPEEKIESRRREDGAGA